MLGAGLLVLIPAALLGIEGNPFGLQATVGGWAGLLVLWSLRLVALLLASHAASVIVRARSPWIVLDLGALLVVAGLYWGAWRRLTLEGVGSPPVLLGTELLDRPSRLDGERIPPDRPPRPRASAGALQVARGRTDLRAGTASSRCPCGGALLAAAVLLHGPLRLGDLPAAPPTSGRSGEIYRRARRAPGSPSPGRSRRRPGYQPTFLYDLSSGRYGPGRFRTVATGFEPQVRFSADGRRAVWLVTIG